MLFLRPWVYKITHKEGRFLFDLLRDILEKCCRNYPRIVVCFLYMPEITSDERDARYTV